MVCCLVDCDATLMVDVTTALTSLVLQMISSRSNLLDSVVVLYATLVGALHRIIGLEFGKLLVPF